MDSSFIIDFLNPEQEHHDDAVSWLQSQSEEPLMVPAMYAFEVLRGTVRAGEDSFDRAVGFLRTMTVLELGLAEAIAAGDLDGRLYAEGVPLSARDTLTAAPAREVGAPLVTRDRDFQAVPELSVALYDSE